MLPDVPAALREEASRLGLWAKSDGQLLVDHLVDVCGQAASFLGAYRPHWPLAAATASPGRTLAYGTLFHDFGKVHPGFQMALRGGPKFQNRHEILSLAFLDWLEVPDTEYGWLAACVATHHKEWSDLKDRFDDPDAVTSDLWHLCRGVGEEAQKHLYEIAAQAPWLLRGAGWGEFSYYPLRPFREINFGAAILRALKAVDGLVSTLKPATPLRPGQTLARNWSPVLAAIYVRGWMLSADHLASFGSRAISAALVSREEVMAAYPAFVWRGHQRALGEHTGSGLLIAPTGSGKTEAALLWASRQGELGSRGRVLILLPYQASLNAMQRRLIARFYPDAADRAERWNDHVGLLHGRVTRYLYEVFLEQGHASREADARAKRGNELARLFAAPLAVGTIFSVIRLLFATRGPERLLVSFSGARIVVDEVHAYQPEVTALALSCLRFLSERLRAEFLLMSATVPRHLEQILDEQVGVKRILPQPIAGEMIRHQLALLPFSSESEEALDAILAAAKQGSVLVVVNQVARAMRVWTRLRERSAERPQLLHSRFHALDRSLIEKGLTPARGVILVGTQAVEVSLDLDFDQCFTEIAPVESIIQRFGRCNRRGRQSCPAPVFVFDRFPETSKPCLPYVEEHLGQVLSVLVAYCAGASRPLGDGDVQALLDSSYPEELSARLVAETRAKMASIQRLFIDEWQPWGISCSAERKQLEEQWEALFEGREVLPAKFLEEAQQDGSWAGTARYLVPMSEHQFRRFWGRGEIERVEELGCYVIHRAYGETGLDLNLSDNAR